MDLRAQSVHNANRSDSDLRATTGSCPRFLIMTIPHIKQPGSWVLGVSRWKPLQSQSASTICTNVQLCPLLCVSLQDLQYVLLLSPSTVVSSATCTRVELLHPVHSPCPVCHCRICRVFPLLRSPSACFPRRGCHAVLHG